MAARTSEPSPAINPRDPALNYVVVKGVRSPGRARLSNIEAPHNWDVKKGAGLSGASVIYHGRDIAHPVLTIEMWLPEHFVQWAAFKDAIKPPTPTAPFFVDMAHPLLSSADIKSVGIENLGEPIRQPGGGLWVATIKLIEYRPWKDSIVKADKSIPAIEKQKPQTAESVVDRALVKGIADLRRAMTGGT